jgi:hypothetical protein
MAAQRLDNYSKLVMRATHATPKNVVLRACPSSHNSQQRFPNVADVRSGTVYGSGQFDQQEYVTGTMSAGGGGGTVVHTFVG